MAITYTNFADGRSPVARITVADNGSVIISETHKGAQTVDKTLSQQPAIEHLCADNHVLVPHEAATLAQIGAKLSSLIDPNYKERLTDGISDQKMEAALASAVGLLERIGVNQVGTVGRDKPLPSPDPVGSRPATPSSRVRQ